MVGFVVVVDFVAEVVAVGPFGVADYLAVAVLGFSAAKTGTVLGLSFIKPLESTKIFENPSCCWGGRCCCFWGC